MALPVAKQSHRRGHADKLRVSNEHAVDDRKPARDPAALRTILVCNVWPSEESALRQYMEDRGASGGGPVERVHYLVGRYCTFVVHFKRHDDAVNVVCRDNHKLNGRALAVFLYDKRNRSVYSGNGTLADQELRDSEEPCTVLFTGLDPFTVDPIDDILFDEIENLSPEIRPAQYICPHKEKGIAFVHYQHHEDAARLVMRGHISIPRPDLYTCITVFLFLYRGPLPDDSNSSHTATDQRGAYRQTSVQTNTAPGAPATAREDFAIETDLIDADSVSVELLPPDTPAAQAQGQAGETQTLQDAMETQTKLFQSLLQTELGRMRTEMEAKMQSEVKRLVSQMGEQLQKQFQSEVSQNRIQMDKMLKTEQSTIARQTENQQGRHSEMPRQMENLRAQLQAEVRRLNSQMERQLQMQAAHQQTDPIELQSQVRSEISQLRTQFRSEVRELDIQLRSEVSALRNKLESDVALPQAQLRSDLNQLQNQMRAAVSQTQLQSEMQKLGRLQSQLDETKSSAEIVAMTSTVNQLSTEMNQLRSEIGQTEQNSQSEGSQTSVRSEMTQLRTQVMHMQSQLQVQQQSCTNSSARTQKSLEMQERMQARMIAETQTTVASQTRAEIVTVMGEIEVLKNQIMQLQNQIMNQQRQNSGHIDTHTFSLRQQNPDLEETASVITVINASGSTSSSQSSHAVS